MRCALLLIASALCFGCSKENPVRPRGLLDAEGRSVERPTNLGRPEATREAEEATDEVIPGALPSPFEVREKAQAAAKAAAEEAAKEKAERDLNKEFEALLGQPSNCLDLEKAAESGRASISVTATVAPSGRVTRASVTASGQPASALACIEQRVLAGSLKGPIENAPLSVSAQTTIEVQRAKPKAQAQETAAARAPSPTNIAQPERNLELAQPADDTELAQPAD